MPTSEQLLQWGLLEVNQRHIDLKAVKARFQGSTPSRTALKGLVRTWEIRAHEAKRLFGWKDCDVDYALVIATKYRREALQRGAQRVV